MATLAGTREVPHDNGDAAAHFPIFDRLQAAVLGRYYEAISLLTQKDIRAIMARC